MRKIIILLLVIGNIISFQFYKSLQHHRDTFALCGSAYNENNNENFDDDESVSEIKRNQIKHGQSKDLSKEIIIESNDHFMNVSINVNLKRYHSVSYFLSMEEIKVDDLFLSSIFKPPKA